MPIVRFDSPQSMASDPPPRALPPNTVSRSRNVRFFEGAAMGTGYWNAEINLVGEVATLFSRTRASDGESQIFYITLSGRACRIDGGISNDVGPDDPFTPGGIWTWCIYGGVIVVNNQIDPPHYYDETAEKFAPFSVEMDWNSNWRPQALRAHKQFLVAINVESDDGKENPFRVIWSDATDPGTLPFWTLSDPSRLGGDQYLTDTAGGLVDGMSLGDDFLLYKNDSIWRMRFIGGVNVWGFTKIDDYGLLTQNCIAQINGAHVFLSMQDIRTTNGGPSQSIANEKVKRLLFNSMDSEHYRNCFVFTYPAQEEVWFCYPDKNDAALPHYDGQCTRAFVWSITNNSWTVIDLPLSRSGIVDSLPASTFVTYDSYLTLGASLTPPLTACGDGWTCTGDVQIAGAAAYFAPVVSPQANISTGIALGSPGNYYFDLTIHPSEEYGMVEVIFTPTTGTTLTFSTPVGANGTHRFAVSLAATGYTVQIRAGYQLITTDEGSTLVSWSGLVESPSLRLVGAATLIYDNATGVYGKPSLSQIIKEILLSGVVTQPTVTYWLVRGSADTPARIEPFDRVLERIDLPIAVQGVDSDTVKFIRACYPEVDVVHSGTDPWEIRVYVGARVTPNQAVNWQGPFVFSASTPVDKFFVGTRLPGRYLSYRLESSGPVAWRLTAINFDVEVASQW